MIKYLGTKWIKCSEWEEKFFCFLAGILFLSLFYKETNWGLLWGLLLPVLVYPKTLVTTFQLRFKDK